MRDERLGERIFFPARDGTNAYADDHAAYLNSTTAYVYDPRDRIASVTKTPTAGTASV